MPLHHQTASLLAALEEVGGPPIESQTPEEARAARAALVRPSTIELPEVRDLDAGGVPARLYRASTDPTPTGLLVWFHGGGFVLGDLESHDDVCRDLCRRSGVSVLSVDYRLAPEHPFPAGLADAIGATRWAHGHAAELGADPARLAVGGDSAGGNLAAVVAQLAPVPLVHQLLVYPVTQARADTGSYLEHGEGKFLTTEGMRWFLDHYLSGDQGSVDDPRVSPLLASDDALAASPPTLVIVAEHDPLRDEGVAYAHRLQAVGVPTTLIEFHGQIHAFFSLTGFLDDADLARSVAAEALARACGVRGAG